MNRIATTAAATIIGGFALLAMTACQAGLDGSGAPAQASALAAQLQANASGAALATPATSSPAISSPADIAAGVSGSAAGSSPAGAGPAANQAGAVVLTTTTGKPATGPGSGSGKGTGPKTGAGNGSGTGHASTQPTQPSSAKSESSGSGNSGSTTTGPSTPAPSIVSASISCDYSDSDQTYHENLSYEVANATGMALSIDNPGIVGSYGNYDWHGTIEIPNLGCYIVNGPQTYTLYTTGGTGPQASKTIVRTGTHSHPSATDTTSAAAVEPPSIVSASISCDYSDSDQTYHESLSYEVANATGMALSIDNPGIVGSYGTYDWHGTIEIPNLGCYTDNGPQTYTLYTIGGTGPQASKTIVRTGTHSHPSATSTTGTSSTSSSTTSTTGN